MSWVVGVLVEARAGARVVVDLLSLGSGTTCHASFLSKSPSPRVGWDAEIFEDQVAFRWRRRLPVQNHGRWAGGGESRWLGPWGSGIVAG